ncbi:lipoprotein [Agrobacterium pusense]
MSLSCFALSGCGNTGPTGHRLPCRPV